MDPQHRVTPAAPPPSPLPPTGGPRRDVLWLLLGVALLAGWLLLAHGRLGVGWGAAPVHRAGRNEAYGIAFNEKDNLSYAAWAQQAARGGYPFFSLYSTEAHAPLLLNPYFYLAGRAAALLGVHPIAVMNLSGFLAALLTVVLVFLACRALSMTRRAAFFAILLLALGSGLDGACDVINLLFHTALPTGPNLGPHGFYDLLPAMAFQAYPYHTVGFMLLAALLACVLWAERRLDEGRRAGVLLALTALAALALSATRPYEPIAFGFCYAAYAAWGRLNRKFKPYCSNTAFRMPRASSLQPAAASFFSLPPRLFLLLLILLAMAPFVLYSAWMARQPVWSSFAALSLDMRQGRLGWLTLFGLFWPASALGLWLRPAARPARLALPGIWAAFLLILFVVFDSPWAKLASGGFLALAILAGQACDQLLDRIQRLPWVGVKVAALLFAALLLLSTACGTLIIFYDSASWAVPTADSEMLTLARLAAQRTPGRPPLILTDCWTGSLLPGLTGARVYAGHWSLTVRYPEKLRELSAAGLEWTPLARSVVGPQPPANPGRALDDLLARAPFDFVLLPRVCPAFPVLRAHPRLRPLRAGADWTLFAVIPR